jgi:mannose-1-phosphate guanylyltransferase/phosphomannomutase
VEIVFFDERGIDIDPGTQRKVERSFYRDDLRRAFHHEIGELIFPARGREYYLQGIHDVVNAEAVRGARPKLVVDYGFGGTVLTGPVVFGRLGVDILAVNAVLDEDRVITTREEAEAMLEQLSALVRSSGADLGALIDPAGERVRLVDRHGRPVPPDLALLAFVDLVGRVTEKPRVAVPVATSRAVEDLVKGRGGEVEWTGLSPAALSAASDRQGMAFAGGGGGGYIFPEFLPAFDGVMSVAKLLELLALSGTTLEEVVEGLPPIHLAAVEVPTPWEAMGSVMRRLVERLDGDRTVTIEGVKAFRGRDWALVVPHPQEPVVRVYAEAGDRASAESLAAEFAALVEELRG